MEAASLTRSRGALASSVILHAIIIFCLVHFVKCDSKEQPVQYMVVEMELAGDWGNLKEGRGETESENPSETPSDDPNAEPSPSNPTPASSPTVSTEKTSTVTAPKGNNTETTNSTNQTSKASDLIKNNSKNGGGKSDGDKDGVGNTGNPDGAIEGKGVFGDGGGGGGWSIVGGELKKKPESDLPSEQGKVVVDIFVDKDGNVTEAIVNPTKSNTTSSALYALAKKAAFTAKFTSRSDGSASKRKGTLTFNYKLS